MSTPLPIAAAILLTAVFHPSAARAGCESNTIVPDDFATIQEAVDNTCAGGSVWVMPGVYPEAVNVHAPNLSIRAGDDEAPVIDRINWIAGVGYLENLAITNELSVAMESLYAEDCTIGSLLISDFTESEADTNITFVDCTFTDVVSIDDAEQDAAIFEGCTFDGVIFDASLPLGGIVIEDCTVNGTRIDIVGTGVAITKNSTYNDGTFAFEGSFAQAERNIVNNVGRSRNAITLDVSGTGPSWAYLNIIDGAARGVVITNTSAAADPLIAANTISDCDWGVIANGSSVWENTIVNCGTGILTGQSGDVTGNTVHLSDTGIWVAQQFGSEWIYRNLVTSCGTGVRGFPAMDTSNFFCNDVWDCATTWNNMPSLTGIQANFSLDPLYCSAADEDLRVDPASPCVPGQHPVAGACEDAMIGARPVGCAVSVGEPDAVPIALSVHPNPTRGPATFGLPADRDVRTFEIFDVSGRRVWHAIAPSGVVEWDGRTASGSAAAPGMYFSRITTPREVVTRSFVIVR